MPSKRPYDEYLEVVKQNSEIAEKKRLRKQAIMSSLIAIYLAIIALFVAQTTVVSRLFPFTRESDKVSNQIQDIKKQLSELKSENDKLREVMSQQNPQSLSYVGFNKRLNDMEADQKTLSDAILLNPEEVVTARLITEKQKILEEQFTSLENSFQRVNDNLNHLLWAAILLPLIALIWNLIKDKLLKKSSANADIF